MLVVCVKMFTDDISFYYPPHYFLHGRTGEQWIRGFLAKVHGDDTWLSFSRFSSSVTTPTENQRPTATNVYDSFTTPLPLSLS